MNKVLFLFLVVLLCTTIVFANENPAKERRLKKRAIRCRCKNNGYYGDEWVFHPSCPRGYGYQYSCGVVFGVCCYPRS
uniref:Type III potassium channel toxin protein n=1 Tax=Anemonia sulcata TaxID=6108 RepID=A0A0S1M186_ANESU|nr:type III potassium channel toxin protein [Anemonia sulcata]